MSIRIVSSNKEKQIFFPFTLYMKVKGKKIWEKLSDRNFFFLHMQVLTLPPEETFHRDYLVSSFRSKN